MAQATDKYLETLQLYYEEEIEGEAYFDAIAERLTDPDERENMRLMAQVEAVAAASVAPLLRKYGLTPSPAAELQASGRASAAEVTKDYATLIAEWRRSFPAYIDDFERLEAMAPPGDLPALRVLTAHEVAAIAYLDLEDEGQPDSAAPMRRYIETGTA